MPIKELIEKNKYTSEIHTAVQHEQYLSFFTELQVENGLYPKLNIQDQPDYGATIFKNVFHDGSAFSAWLQSWMRKANYQSLMPFLRYPLPTTDLIQKDIIPTLRQVFEAEDSNFEYIFNEESTRLDQEMYFKQEGLDNYMEKEFFDILLYKHNSIIIHDIPEGLVNAPIRNEVRAKQVKGISKTRKGKIKEIAFVEKRGKDDLYFYFTQEVFSVYSRVQGQYVLLNEIPHNLGYCPAHFASPQKLNSKSWFARKNIFFSAIQSKLEHYVLFNAVTTLSNMHGGFPIVSKYKKTNQPCGTMFVGSRCQDGYLTPTVPNSNSSNSIQALNKDKLTPCPICNAPSDLQPGSVLEFKPPIPQHSEDNPPDLNVNPIKFHHTPVDLLKFWPEDLGRQKDAILNSVLGQKEEETGQAENVDQIARSERGRKNTLIDFSELLSEIRKELDKTTIDLRYGPSVLIDSTVDYGSDFITESENAIRAKLSEATDPLQRRQLRSRLNSMLFRNNRRRLQRAMIEERLMPYVDIPDERFYTLTVDPRELELRSNFYKYIQTFEDANIDLVEFINNLPQESMNDRIQIVRDFLYELVNNNINNGTENSLSPESR